MNRADEQLQDDYGEGEEWGEDEYYDEEEEGEIDEVAEQKRAQQLRQTTTPGR